MQISESDHCDSDLTENQSDYNTPHHKISRFSILISIGTWENRGQTDALLVTGARPRGQPMSELTAWSISGAHGSTHEVPRLVGRTTYL